MADDQKSYLISFKKVQVPASSETDALKYIKEIFAGLTMKELKETHIEFIKEVPSV